MMPELLRGRASSRPQRLPGPLLRLILALLVCAGNCRAEELLCGGVLRASQGRITSPMTPGTNRYPPAMFCIWLIATPEGEKVQLAFEKMALESSSSCAFDYVEVRNGEGAKAPSALRACGSKLPSRFLSTGNVTTVIFKSDYSIAGEGFVIRYETVPSPLIHNEKSNVTELRAPPGVE